MSTGPNLCQVFFGGGRLDDLFFETYREYSTTVVKHTAETPRVFAAPDRPVTPKACRYWLAHLWCDGGRVFDAPRLSPSTASKGPLDFCKTAFDPRSGAGDGYFNTSGRASVFGCESNSLSYLSIVIFSLSSCFCTALFKLGRFGNSNVRPFPSTYFGSKESG